MGYARVSKENGQDTATQVAALKAAGVKRLYEEHASGGRWDRPELHRALDQLRIGDIFVVWKLDRLSRSLKDLLHIMEQIESVGAGFRSLTEAIDTTSSAGRMLMQNCATILGLGRQPAAQPPGAPEGLTGARRPAACRKLSAAAVTAHDWLRQGALRRDLRGQLRAADPRRILVLACMQAGRPP